MALIRSCAFATSLDSPEHARIAEQLGYTRAWFYDSPALYPDVWAQLTRAAECTERIGLGTGVLVPALRHPMVTASAIATLVEVAGRDRVVVGVGTGFTGRLALGQRPSRWADVTRYIEVVRALLRGEQAEWEGAAMRMLHRPGFTPTLPVEVPFVLAAAGPKGVAAARSHAAGVLTVTEPVAGFDWCVYLTLGTVLGEGEDPGSARAIEAGGPAASVFLHWALEFDRLDLVPRGEQWAAAYADLPAGTRHLALHDGHLCAVNDRDRPFLTGEVLTVSGAALRPAAWRERLAKLAAAGVTEIAYQPAGPDIPRELEAFAAAMDDR